MQGLRNSQSLEVARAISTQALVTGSSLLSLQLREASSQTPSGGLWAITFQMFD